MNRCLATILRVNKTRNSRINSVYTSNTNNYNFSRVFLNSRFIPSLNQLIRNSLEESRNYCFQIPLEKNKNHNLRFGALAPNRSILTFRVSNSKGARSSWCPGPGTKGSRTFHTNTILKKVKDKKDDIKEPQDKITIKKTIQSGIMAALLTLIALIGLALALDAPVLFFTLVVFISFFIGFMG